LRIKNLKFKIMKSFHTETRFVPLLYKINEGMSKIKNADGTEKEFKTRKAAENYCKNNGLVLLEKKLVFYK